MEKKHIVQFSGGAASALVAKMVVDKFGKENVILLHSDTKAEDLDTYRFIEHVSNFLDVPITDASDGRSLWQVIEDEHCLPSSFIPFCTRILKQEPADRYLKSLDCQYTLYNGLGMEEWKRVAKAQARAGIMDRKLVCPIFDAKISNQHVKNIIRNEWKICLPNAYKTLEHNNCIPCFKAGQGHFRKVWQYYPEEFAKAVAMEELIGHTVFKKIIRLFPTKVVEKISLTELEQKWRRGGEMDNLFGNDGIPCMCSEF